MEKKKLSIDITPFVYISYLVVIANVLDYLNTPLLKTFLVIFITASLIFVNGTFAILLLNLHRFVKGTLKRGKITISDPKNDLPIQLALDIIFFAICYSKDVHGFLTFLIALRWAQVVALKFYRRKILQMEGKNG